MREAASVARAAFNRKQVEHCRQRPTEPAGRQTRSNHDTEQRHEHEEAQAFEQRSERDKDRGDDALAPGKGHEIAQQVPQISCESRAARLIGMQSS